MNFTEALNHLYYEESLHELTMRNNRRGNRISYNTVLYLDAITYMPGCTVSELAKRLHVSKSAVTMKVREMLAQGLIEKEQSGEDKRVYYLHPKKGMTELFIEYKEALAATETYLNDKYTESEMKIFSNILEDAAEKYVKELKNSESFDH